MKTNCPGGGVSRGFPRKKKRAVPFSDPQVDGKWGQHESGDDYYIGWLRIGQNTYMKRSRFEYL